jgi:hypothetical protein
MTADINSNVAEKALCWCEGRRNRSRRAKPWAGRPSGESAEFAIKGRFYTQTLHCPDTRNGSWRCDEQSGYRSGTLILSGTVSGTLTDHNCILTDDNGTHNPG